MIDRRVNNPKFNEHMDMLTDEQRIAIYDLHNYGYDLAFVRNLGNGKLAVLTLEDSVATIDDYGEINTNPSILIR